MIDAKSLLDSLVDGVSQLGDKLQHVQPGEILEKARDTAGGVLDQATSGVKELSGKAVEATGADEKLDAVVGKMTGGKTTEDLVAQAKDFVAENKLAAGVFAAGVGAMLLGSKRGRKVTKNAAKVGGVALIGGLAYQAFQNFKEGKPLFADAEVTAAPLESGFDPDSLTNEQALLLVRSMVAAAAADAKIDEEERLRIALGLREAGLEPEAVDFMENEFKNPVSVETLAAGADSPEFASQVYTAARLTIEPDTPEETTFLERLGAALGMEKEMLEHLNAAASAVKAA